MRPLIFDNESGQDPDRLLLFSLLKKKAKNHKPLDLKINNVDTKRDYETGEIIQIIQVFKVPK